MMVDFLILQIKMGKITVDKIPTTWKNAVIAKLNLND